MIVQGRKKIAGELVTITVAILGFIAACIPVAYHAYTKHQEMKQKQKEFKHSDIRVRNMTSINNVVFELWSIGLVDTVPRLEKLITVNSNSTEEVSDYLEDKIKKENRLIKGIFNHKSHKISVRCDTTSLNALDCDINFKLVGNLTNGFRCE